jgi:hypothetical protein
MYCFPSGDGISDNTLSNDTGVLNPFLCRTNNSILCVPQVENYSDLTNKIRTTLIVFKNNSRERRRTNKKKVEGEKKCLEPNVRGRDVRRMFRD